MNEKDKIEQLHDLAIERNGKCLSDRYMGNNTKLMWLCFEKHSWESTPHNIKSGKWCPYCAKNTNDADYHYNELKSIAESKSGTVLSSKYINNHTKMKFKCKEGHEWEAAPASIKKGTWCKKCTGNERSTIERYINIAKEKGGICLTTSYENKNTELTIQCSNGHIWSTKATNIASGRWCPICASKEKGIKLRCTIEEMKQLALDKDGECLSKEYLGDNKSLMWKCKFGHTWEARPTNIKYGTWCPYCAGVSQDKKYHLDKLIEIARSNNGQLLSKNYINDAKKLKWKCAKNHIWHSNPSSIKQGSWCPKCSREKAKGEGHYFWKGGITSLSRYLRQHVDIWRKESLIKYDYQCAITKKLVIYRYIILSHFT